MRDESQRKSRLQRGGSTPTKRIFYQQIVEAPLPVGHFRSLGRRRIDDLPMVKSSALVARGEITRQSKTARIKFDGSDVEYQLGVVIYHMPSGGFWGRFVCPRCGGPSHRIRLLDDRPACCKCARGAGLVYRSQHTNTGKRHLVTAPPRLAMLNSKTSLFHHRHHDNILMERRANIELALRRSLLVARKHRADRAKGI